jgi:hypothetical protein
MKTKAGYKTSEFWVTVVSVVFSCLYLVGIISEKQQSEELIHIVSTALESCIVVAGQLYVFYRYVKGRTEVKKIEAEEQLKYTEMAVPEQVVEEIVRKVLEEKNNESKNSDSGTIGKNSGASQRKPNKRKKS